MRWLGPGTNAAEEDQLPALASERFHGVDAPERAPSLPAFQVLVVSSSKDPRWRCTKVLSEADLHRE